MLGEPRPPGMEVPRRHVFGLLDNTQPLRETSCKSRRSPFLLLSLLLWPWPAAPRRKKPPLPKPLPPLLKPLPPLLKLPPRPLKPLLRPLKPLPRPLTPLLRLPPRLPKLLRLPRPLRPSNRLFTELIQKGCFGTLFYCLFPRFPDVEPHP